MKFNRIVISFYYPIVDIKLIMKKNTRFCIFFKDFTGKCNTIYLKPEDTIGYIKKRFENLSGYPTGLRYIYSGKQLYDDHLTLLERNIPDQSTIHVVGRLL